MIKWWSNTHTTYMLIHHNTAKIPQKQQIGTLKLQIHALVHSKHTHKHSDNKHQIHSHESKFNWDFCLPDVILSLSEVSSWIICDGDIDPEWIESLNSVLDDNRLLTMPSGERIQFGPTSTSCWDPRSELCLTSHHLPHGHDLPQVSLLNSAQPIIRLHPT